MSGPRDEGGRRQKLWILARWHWPLSGYKSKMCDIQTFLIDKRHSTVRYKRDWGLLFRIWGQNWISLAYLWLISGLESYHQLLDRSKRVQMYQFLLHVTMKSSHWRFWQWPLVEKSEKYNVEPLLGVTFIFY